MAILQFGAIELSDVEFAIAYLSEIEYHLRREGGKEFLFAFFEENWSPYAKTFTYRIEDEALDFLKAFDEHVSTDAISDKKTDGLPDTDGTFSDLGEALATHVGFMAYRFQFFGDEDVVEKMKAV